MEAIGAIIGGIIFLVIINVVIRTIFGTAKAGFDTLTKGGNFGDHFKANTLGMSPFEIRVQEVGPNAEHDFTLFEVQARGVVPLNKKTVVAVISSLADITDQHDAQPVLSRVPDFAEPTTPAYQFSMEPIEFSPNMGFIEWSRIAVVIPHLIDPPKKGTRKLAVIVRLTDASLHPPITLGFTDPNTPGILATYEDQFSWAFTENGYAEARELTLKQKPLYVRLAVAVAFSDGNFDESEGRVIKEWTVKQLTMFSGAEHDKLKEDCNRALREAYADGQAGKLSLSKICNSIIEISEPSDRYEGIELALDVMAADGVADPEELETIRKIANMFDLDFDELQRLKDARMVKLNPAAGQSLSPEATLGIDPSWPKEKVRAFLTSEFKKWNGRLNNVTDGVERENIQAHLDLISEVRKKYA